MEAVHDGKPRGRSAEPKPFSRTEQRGRRWRIKITNGKDERETDSQVSRLVRCQRRVKSWSDTLPRLNRRHRRAYRGRVGPRTLMLTLTYKDGSNWEPNHIREFMLDLRKDLQDKLWAYAWVMEMQQRGVPHYHVMVYVSPGTDVPAPDDSGLWRHGSTRRETAKLGAKYILKYVGKEYQKEGLPHGARMFAVWIGKKQATADEMFGFKLSAAPPWLQPLLEKARDQVGHPVVWKRVAGGGWVVVETGEFHQSEWYLLSVVPIEPTLITEREDE